MFWIMIIALFAIMYFFMIRPQRKKQKEIENFRKALHVGQEVITAGGIHGTIRQIDEASNVIITTGFGSGQGQLFLSFFAVRP